MMRAAQATAPGTRHREASTSDLDRPVAGRWSIDAHRSTLRVGAKVGLLLTVSGTFADVCGVVQIADDPTASQVQVAVATASLSSGSSCMDALLHGAGLIDSARNPTIDFTSRAVRPSRSIGSWLLDGVLTTTSARLPVTLTMRDPVARNGCLTFRASGAVPSGEAVRLLSQPGVERVLGPTLQLDLAVAAIRA
jgi:polyisoprenoid-binding protein YceI